MRWLRLLAADDEAQPLAAEPGAGRPALAEPGGDPLPDRPGGAPPQGEEADAEVLQLGEHGAGGEAGVEQQLPGRQASTKGGTASFRPSLRTLAAAR